MNIEKTAVFVQTNDAASNQVVVFSRGEDGGLASIATHDTGGRGAGSPHLPSQGSVLAADGRVFSSMPVATISRSSRSIRTGWRSSTGLLPDRHRGVSPSVAISCTCSAPGGSSASASTPPGSSRRSRVPNGR